MQYAYERLKQMLNEYEQKHAMTPDVIALGKTHLDDLQGYFQAKPDGLYFDGIEVIQHNDPIGVLMAHRNE